MNKNKVVVSGITETMEMHRLRPGDYAVVVEPEMAYDGVVVFVPWGGETAETLHKSDAWTIKRGHFPKLRVRKLVPGDKITITIGKDA